MRCVKEGEDEWWMMSDGSTSRAAVEMETSGKRVRWWRGPAVAGAGAAADQGIVHKTVDVACPAPRAD